MAKALADLKTDEVPSNVDPEDWTLSVTGTVEQLLVLDLEDLRSLDTRSTVADVTCIDGWTADDLAVEGIHLGDLLARARPTAETAFGLISTMDGEFACVLPLDRLMDCLLATWFDGKTLPTEQDGPVRLVPLDEDKHCWEHVKWVSRIELYEREPTEDDTACERVLSPTD